MLWFLDGSQYFEGFFEAGKLLIDNFMQQEQICLNKVTVIGEINQSILNELKKDNCLLLERLFSKR